ncbi:MAG: DNA gyrase subunit A [Candidatus Marinimicrobia bacterium]|nr:DNA gyrase subunit A [Candidatus Neomarinimicrobiota bacterium]
MEVSPGKTEPREIVDEISESYLNYSMSVIVSRALPDVRDGLKPVHRRVLYGMSDLGVAYNRGYKKCARIVGDVMGKYHPHGDASVYDTLVRMAQPWSLRYPLVDGQGNFGSIDGDSAAAMRYTEARMTRLSSELLRDLDKDTVDFVPNFDDSLKEPSVLPAMVPTLLVNGSDGIAVGMATKIPPHNLNEVVNALIALIDKYDGPGITVEELMTHIKGPDFPTGAYILGSDGFTQAYRGGRGLVIVRARATMEEIHNDREQIVITEIPYQTNKSLIIERIADLVRTKKLEGIRDLRDESDKDGIRIVIEVKRDAIPEVVLNNLYKHTQLQETYGIILLALVNGVPKVLTLKAMLTHFVDFRHEVVVRRTKFELKQAEERAHILEGLKIALDHIDEVIAIIRGSDDPEAANRELKKKFKFSDRQSKAILEMRLQRLTSLEVDKVIAEYNETMVIIEDLQGILGDKGRRMGIIKDELLEIQERYGDERRTEIVQATGDFSVEDMIADEDMVITVSHNGFIKRSASSQWRRQRRGGRGMQGATTREDDFVEHLFIATSHAYILFFTDRGKCYWLKVHEIPPAGRLSRGRAIVNLIGCETGEKVQAFVAVRDFPDNHYVVMATRQGLVKRTALSAYSHPRKGGIYAIDIQEGDELIEAKISHGDDDIIFGTRMGKSIRFHESDARPMGRKTRGVRGIRLASGNDYVVGMMIVRREGTVLVVTENGYGKRTDVLQYRTQHRGGKGLITLRTTEKVGHLMAMLEVVDSDDLMIITDGGVMIRLPVMDIRTIGRNTQGVRVIRLDEGARIASISRIVEDDEDDEGDEGEEETEYTPETNGQP